MRWCDIRSIFDSSDSESENEPLDAPEEGLCYPEQNNTVTLINPTVFDVSSSGWEMEGGSARSLFCSTCLPLDDIAIGDAPASWGRFFRVEGYEIRVPSGPSECSLEIIHPLDDIEGQERLFLYLCSDRPKPCICIIVVE